MRRPSVLRNPAAIALALCLALGWVVQGGWVARAGDSPQSSERWQPARDHAAIALGNRGPQARTAHLHRSPVFGLKVSGFPIAAAPPVSALLTNCRLPFPRSRAVMPRSGRSPPLSI